MLKGLPTTEVISGDRRFTPHLSCLLQQTGDGQSVILESGSRYGQPYQKQQNHHDLSCVALAMWIAIEIVAVCLFSTDAQLSAIVAENANLMGIQRLRTTLDKTVFNREL